MAIPIFEQDRWNVGGKIVKYRRLGFPIVGVHERDKGLVRQLLTGPPQMGGPSGIQALEVSIQAGDALQVEGFLEEM